MALSKADKGRRDRLLAARQARQAAEVPPGPRGPMVETSSEGGDKLALAAVEALNSSRRFLRKTVLSIAEHGQSELIAAMNSNETGTGDTLVSTFNAHRDLLLALETIDGEDYEVPEAL